jgi:UDP-GlcNAc3NAcA epimerase
MVVKIFTYNYNLNIYNYNMKIVSIVGTRPQFLKLAPLEKKFKKEKINNITIHSGQHYDKEMSDEIFNTLNISKPKYILDMKGDSKIQKLSNMMIEIEKILLIEKPDKVIVFGDCDTTIVGSIVANKLKIYLIHIESGMRSYNKDMPEEINRLITDNISNLLLCSTKDSVNKLNKENIKKNVYYVGNLQLELLKQCCLEYNNEDILRIHNLEKNNFILLTIHREYNTNKESLSKLFKDLNKLKKKIIFPIHPRTKNTIKEFNINVPSNIILIKPVNYLNITILERYCEFIITDSGGIQPEAWFLRKKCIVMRTETEWIEPLKNNNNILYDYKTNIFDFINNFLKKKINNIDNKIDINVSENILKYILLNN